MTTVTDAAPSARAQPHAARRTEQQQREPKEKEEPNRNAASAFAGSFCRTSRKLRRKGAYMRRGAGNDFYRDPAGAL